MLLCLIRWYEFTCALYDVNMDILSSETDSILWMQNLSRLFTTILVDFVWIPISTSQERFAWAFSTPGLAREVKFGTQKTPPFFKFSSPFKLLYSMKGLILTRLDMTHRLEKLRERKTQYATMRMHFSWAANPCYIYYASHPR